MAFEKSRIYTFMDESKRFSINFFDAQKFVHDAITIQNMPVQATNFLKDSLLAYPTLLSFTKPGEEFGLYLDSSDPYFLFKFESFQLKARTLLLPETLAIYPEKIKGLCRLQKYIPNNPNPYTSMIEMDYETPAQIFDKILAQSYQIDATLQVSTSSNQSLMIYRIPDEGGIGLSPQNNLKNNFNPDRQETLQFFNSHKAAFEAIFAKKHDQLINIVRDMEKIGFDYLVSRVIDFACRCSKENFVDRISTFGADEIKQMFDTSATLDITCDYCKTHYQITKDSFPDLIQH